MFKTEAEPKPPQIARMDFGRGILKGRLSGKTYFIQEELAAERYAQFLAYQPLITKGTSYQDWAETNNEIHRLATNGSDIMGALFKIATITMNDNATYRDFSAKRMMAMVWFSMLFVNAEDEDVGLWDERLVQIKVDDLKHYSIQDFFFLVSNILKDWRRNFRKQMGFDPVDAAPPGMTVEDILSQESSAIT